MINIFKKKKFDYLANTYPLPAKYPDGMDIEIFSQKTLKKTYQKANLPSEREHVTPFMFKSKIFKTGKKDCINNLSKFRFCIDYYEDYKLLCHMINHFKSRIYDLSMEEIVNYVRMNPSLIHYQKDIVRNEGWSSALKRDKKYRK